MGDAPGEGANQMGVAYSDDLLHWTEPLDHPVLGTEPESLTLRSSNRGRRPS